MTLLLGAISPSRAWLAADGQCVKGEGNKSQVFLNYQKIFPVPNRPLAFAHHGQNVLVTQRGTKIPIKQAIEQFCEDEAASIKDGLLPHIANVMLEYFQGIVRETFSMLQGEYVIGFWVAGIGAGETRPGLIEVVWHNSGGTAENVWKTRPGQGGITTGGYGQRYIDTSKSYCSYHWRELCHARRDYIEGYVRALWDYAVRAQSKDGESEFGGHRHQLEITKDECSWVEPPEGIPKGKCH